ncbi:endonuclease/exonuclease/phosphatase family protein, partial [Klebsiella pneumoniae]
FSHFSWNVRGLGDYNKCSIVRDSILSARPNIVCLQETKLSQIDRLKPCSFLPAYLDAFQTLDADDTRGGILTAWDS